MFGKFLNLLMQVHINLPLFDVLQGIPKNAKYVKEIVVNKSRLIKYATVKLMEEYSFVIQTNCLLIERSLKFHNSDHYITKYPCSGFVRSWGKHKLDAHINV